jgi:hypothetical protein
MEDILSQKFRKLILIWVVISLILLILMSWEQWELVHFDKIYSDQKSIDQSIN